MPQPVVICAELTRRHMLPRLLLMQLPCAARNSTSENRARPPLPSTSIRLKHYPSALCLPSIDGHYAGPIVA